jgi:hypothetical protein
MLCVVCAYIVITIAVMILAPGVDRHPKKHNKNKSIHKIDEKIEKEEK